MEVIETRGSQKETRVMYSHTITSCCQKSYFISFCTTPTWIRTRYSSECVNRKTRNTRRNIHNFQKISPIYLSSATFITHMVINEMVGLQIFKKISEARSSLFITGLDCRMFGGLTTTTTRLICWEPVALKAHLARLSWVCLECSNWMIRSPKTWGHMKLQLWNMPGHSLGMKFLVSFGYPPTVPPSYYPRRCKNIKAAF